MDNKGWGNVGESKDDGANKGTFDYSHVSNPFRSLIETQSLMSFNNNISEMKDITKVTKETLKKLESTAAADSTKNSIPKLLDLSAEQSPNLPGFVLYTVYGTEVYLMPVLFYKRGATDTLETINTGVGTPPQTYNKFAENFMNEELHTKVKNSFAVVEGVTMTTVKVIAGSVVDIDQYLKVARSVEDAVQHISSRVMKDWYTSALNFGIMLTAVTDPSKLPNPFRDGKLLGKDDTAVARIDVPPYPMVLDGVPAAYNLQVKLATAPKGNIHSNNSNIVKTVATTFLNVSLEVMSPEMYRRTIIGNTQGIPTGPLVPVISIGRTIPGEQFHNNDSIITDLMGIFTALCANNPLFFSEAFRQREVGSRGSLANLAEIAYQTAGVTPPNDKRLTAKNMIDQPIVMDFMRRFISPRAVFVMDIPTFIDRPSNAEFWVNLGMANTGASNYYKAFVMMADKLSNGEFTRLANDARDKNAQGIWKPGDAIIKPSPVIIPVGTASGRKGAVFNLEEVDQMMLRDPACYGNNEVMIATLMSLLNGSCGKDLRIRQYEIKKALDGLFNNDVDVVGWKSRWVLDDKFLNLFVQSMAGAGSISTTANNTTHAWQTQVSNDYLLNVASATVQNGINNSGVLGNVFRMW